MYKLEKRDLKLFFIGASLIIAFYMGFNKFQQYRAEVFLKEVMKIEHPTKDQIKATRRIMR